MLEKDLVKNLTIDIQQSGCWIYKKNDFYTSQTGNFIYTFTKKEFKLRQIQVTKLGEFFSKSWFDLLNIKIDGRTSKEWLRLSDEDIELALKTNPRNLPWTMYFGLDYSGISQKITDLNSDRAVIIGYQDEIAKVFSKYFKELNFKSYYDYLIPFISNLTNKRHSKVFVLHYKNEQHIRPYEEFAKKFNYDIGPISSFNPRKYDLVLRQVKSEEIINNQKEYSLLIDYLKDGGLMMNPLGSFLSGNKGWMTILSFLNLVPREWFPKSWLISGNKVLGSQGDVVDLKDLANKVQDQKLINNRKNYILKRGFSSGGYEVSIGEDLKRYEWENLWKNISIDKKNIWVLEEKLPKFEKDILVASCHPERSNNKTLDIHVERLNLIERIYSVGDFNNFCSEIFGKRANKVNSSGYSFPVHYR